MVVSSASQASSTGAKGGFLYTRFNPRGQKGLICTRDNFTMARRGQNGWICPREPIVVSERGGFVHVGWRALIIVDFDVVIIDPIASIDVPHRQPGSSGGTHSASLCSALLPSPASSLPRELVSGRHLPLPEAVGRPRPPRPPDCPAAPLSIFS